MTIPRIPAGPYLQFAWVVLLAWAFAVPAQGAPISGISGTWGATQYTQFTIKGFGKRSVRGDGNCLITVRDSFNASLFCRGFNESLGQTYSGGLSAAIRGQRLAWSLDAAGLAQVRANMTRWLIAKNQAKGKILAPSNVSYEFENLSYKAIKLSQGLTQPVLAKAVFKGRTVQLINGRYTVKPFTYTLKIKFLAPVR